MTSRLLSDLYGYKIHHEEEIEQGKFKDIRKVFHEKDVEHLLRPCSCSGLLNDSFLGSGTLCFQIYYTNLHFRLK